ncbi:MAG: AAA family ATPase [Bifidobacterium bifidum]|nr:AAA family ATPase [Bifidobacterium bifidum]
MMIPRTIAQELTPMLSWFPVVSVTGPRQSGKSTLIKNMLPDYEYVNLEDETTLISAIDDPVGFIRSHGAKLIIDEVQHAPGLFAQIQVAADEQGGRGQYVLSGSQNFLMEKRIRPISGGARGHAQLPPPLV